MDQLFLLQITNLFKQIVELTRCYIAIHFSAPTSWLTCDQLHSVMDTDRIARAIEGLKNEKKILVAQMEFPRQSGGALIKELISHVKQLEPSDPWTDKAIAKKTENKFKKSTCAIS